MTYLQNFFNADYNLRAAGEKVTNMNDREDFSEPLIYAHAR